MFCCKKKKWNKINHSIYVGQITVCKTFPQKFYLRSFRNRLFSTERNCWIVQEIFDRESWDFSYNDTDSTALNLIFVSDTNSDLPEEKFRDIILEVIVVSKIYKRFDISHKPWDSWGG